MAKTRSRDTDSTPAELRKASRGVRLHKAMADAGVASRRDCEAMIAQGRVSVNGHRITQLPIWVDPESDRIAVDGRPIARAAPAHTYLLVNKPRATICTSEDEYGRRTVLDLVPHGRRLFCVGRLDADSTGLVLLTDDGDLANQLSHPRYGVPKSYEVSIAGRLSQQDIERLNKGLYLADKSGQTAKASASRVVVLDGDRERTRVRITLKEGRNREIRRMLARLGYNVKRLKRISLGPLQLKGVELGAWRALTRHEVGELRKTAHRKSAHHDKSTPPRGKSPGGRSGG